MQLRFTLLSLFLFILFHASAQEELKVAKIVFTGNDSIPADVLLDIMNTKTRSRIQKLEFWKKDAVFSHYTFKDDLARLKKHYQQNGFIDPLISAELIPNKKNTKLRIEIHVEQGKVITNGKITVSVLGDSLDGASIYSPELPLPLKPGRRFRDDDLRASEKGLLEKFNDNAYPFTEIESNLVLDESMGQSHVNFTIYPGKKAYFGDLILRGDSLIPRSFINKHIELNKGDAYSQIKLDKTQEELFDMGLFRYVTIRALLDSIRDDMVPISIQVNERPRWSFKVGLGYGTEDKIRASFLLTRLNFLGGARTFMLKAQRSYYFPLSLNAKFIQPDLGFKNLDFIFNPFLSSEREETYTVDRLGTALSFQKDFSQKKSAYLSYNLGVDRVDLSDNNRILLEEASDTIENVKSGVTIGFNRSTCDQAVSPSKGWKYSIIGSLMGIGFNSSYHYYKLISEVNYFFPLARETVLAYKLKGGIIAPLQGDLFTPIEDRFLMGGALSLRGWGRNLISPINSAGVKIGGNTIMESSLELRFPIYGIISGATFMDFGNVWQDAWHFNLSDMHYNVGLGLRLKSPVGPIRFDVATPMSEDKLSAQFFITIGHAF